MPFRQKNETYEDFKKRCLSRPVRHRNPSPIRTQSNRRRTENAQYSQLRKQFLSKYPVCVVTGETATQIHHSAQRYGRWLLLQKYWCPVSAEGHRIIEENKSWAESRKLIVRIQQTYDEWMDELYTEEYLWTVDLTTPIIVIDRDNLRDILMDIKNKVVK